ncbi:MAG: serine/threonine-protein phosphatase [Methylococcales bacterium]|jgi:protein phosphatase|nr:serine/threonine-protein phosphatase [Methylococcales bacterium]MBT7408519.1 serine/threonine-protein phosphatase [Methylococcales bacterium]
MNSTTIKTTVAGLSDVGNVRKLNEDNYSVNTEHNLYVVADGMGGHDKGEVASKEAIEVIDEFVTQSYEDIIDSLDDENDEPDDDATLVDEPNPAIQIISDAIELANKKIHAMNSLKGYTDGQGMGTTVAGVWLHQNCKIAISFHVGDSRIYRYRDGKLIQISRDHTLYQFWEDNGRKGEPPTKNIILRAVGPWDETSSDINIHGVANQDMFLVCSDGLTGSLSDEDIENVLKDTTNENLDEACKKLIEQAKVQDGSDNITVIITHCNTD